MVYINLTTGLDRRWGLFIISVLKYGGGVGWRVAWVAANGPTAYGRLNAEWRQRASAQEQILVAALIAHRTPCSDFRLTSHVSRSRTDERGDVQNDQGPVRPHHLAPRGALLKRKLGPFYMRT